MNRTARNILTFSRDWLLANWLGAVVVLLLGFAFGAVFAATPTPVEIGCSGPTCLQTATLTWTAPTQNTDGTPVTLSGYNVYYGTSAANVKNYASGGTPAISALVPSVLSQQVRLPLGTHYFAVTAYACYSSPSDCKESDLSGIVSKTIDPPKTTPKPPGLVTITLVAYDVQWSWKARAYVLNRPVGTVPLGTACTADFTIAGGYAKVARKAVTLTSRTSSPVIVARCG